MDCSSFIAPLIGTIALVGAFVAVGLLLGLLQSLVDAVLSIFLGSAVERGWSTLFLPGVMMHEFAHALFLMATGAQVTEIVVREGTRHPWVVYTRRGYRASCSYARGTAGHVCYRRRGPYPLQSIQRVVGAMAPTVVGVICLLLLGNAIATRCTLWWHYALAIYLFICTLNGATMSTADIKDMAPGLPVCLGIVYAALLVTGFDATSLLPVGMRQYLASFPILLQGMLQSLAM